MRPLSVEKSTKLSIPERKSLSANSDIAVFMPADAFSGLHKNLLIVLLLLSSFWVSSGIFSKCIEAYIFEMDLIMRSSTVSLLQISFTTNAEADCIRSSVSVFSRGLSTPMNPTSLPFILSGAAIRHSIPCKASILYSSESSETSSSREFM